MFFLQADNLVKRGHFEKEAIETQTGAISQAFQQLENKVKSQKGQLLIKQKIYQVTNIPIHLNTGHFCVHYSNGKSTQMPDRKCTKEQEAKLLCLVFEC